MISKEHFSNSALPLAGIALVAVFSGLWMTRPVNMDHQESIVAAAVIYVIVAGAPQFLVFAAAVSSARRGWSPSSAWRIVADVVPLLQLGAGATFAAAAILDEERLLGLGVAALVAAAFVAVASSILISRVGYEPSGEARGP
jgi:hypothetical protein